MRACWAAAPPTLLSSQPPRALAAAPGQHILARESRRAPWHRGAVQSGPTYLRAPSRESSCPKLLSWLLTFEADHQLQESMDALAMAAYAMFRVLFHFLLGRDECRRPIESRVQIKSGFVDLQPCSPSAPASSLESRLLAAASCRRGFRRACTPTRHRAPLSRTTSA